MKLPTPEAVQQHLRVHFPEVLAWWILNCEGTVQELRIVAYSILACLPVMGLDMLLKEVVHPIARSGRVKREMRCQQCEEVHEKIVAHHINYQRPLDVYWLCTKCHSGIHSNGTSWLDSEEMLSPVCERAVGTYSTQRFPLLDAFWEIREEVRPLQVARIIALHDAVLNSVRGRPVNKTPIPDPYAQVVLAADQRDEVRFDLVELVKEFAQ